MPDRVSGQHFPGPGGVDGGRRPPQRAGPGPGHLPRLRPVGLHRAASARPGGPYYNNPGNDYPLDRPGRFSTGYAPGSTWKLITATAMLRYGLRTPGTVYYDGRAAIRSAARSSTTTTTPSWAMSTWPKRITESSDTYFYSLGGQFYQQYDYGKGGARPRPPAGRRLAVRPGPLQRRRPPGRGARPRPRRPGHRQEHAQYPQDYPDGVLGAGLRSAGGHRRRPGPGDPAPARQCLRRLRQRGHAVRPPGGAGRGGARARATGPTGRSSSCFIPGPRTR